MKLKREPAPFITITVPMYDWFQKLLNEEAASLAKTGSGSLSHHLIDLAMSNMASRGLVSKDELIKWKKISPESGKTTPFTERKEHRVFSVYVPQQFSWVKERLKQAAEIQDAHKIKRSVSKYLWNLFFAKNKSRVLSMQDSANKGRADKDLEDYKKEWTGYLGKHLHDVSDQEQSYKRGTDKNPPQKVPLSAQASSAKGYKKSK